MRWSAKKFMYLQNDATAPLRVSFILKPAAPDIISRKINRADRDAVSSSPCSENFDHLILISLDSGKCQSKLGQSRRSVAVDTRELEDRQASSAVPVPRISWGWRALDLLSTWELSGPVKNPPRGVPAIKDKIKPHGRTPAARSSGAADTGS